jgi:hypothetical protein
MKIFFLVFSTVAGVSLRSKVADFGCTDNSGGPCISPNLIGSPDKLNPSTISTSINDAGFVMATAVEGDDGRDGDPGAPREPDEDPAAQYMIVAPVLDNPPPLPALIHCQAIEECTTTTTTIPPGA